MEIYLEPRDVPVADARKVLAFLNAAQSAEEIAATVEFPHERDVGVRVGQRLLDRRAQLGSFTTLDEVADVPQVGPERFTEIVVALAGVGVLVGSRVDEALRDRLRELEAAVADLRAAAARPRVTLRALAAGPFLGEPVVLLAEAFDADGEPAVDAALTVVSTFGRLESGDDPERETGQAVTLRTGIDGRAELRLTPPSAEYLWDTQQAALDTSLALLDHEAATPREAQQGLEELARQYRWEAASDLRHAVDVYFRDFRRREVENVNFRDRLDSWSFLDATVTAVLVDGTSVAAGATLAVRLKDWLGPWVDAYTALLEADAELERRLRDVGRAQAKDPDRLLEGVQGQVRAFVDRQRGLAGAYAGERVAEKSMLGFLEREVGQLPLDARLQLFPALQSGSQTIAHVGVGAFGAIAQTQVQLRGEIRRRTGGLVDGSIFDGRLAAFELAQDAKLGQLSQRLDRKADATELTSFRGQISRSLDEVTTRVTGLERGRG